MTANAHASRLSDIVASLRGRRRVTDPDALLDECLSLLDRIASTPVGRGSTWPMPAFKRRRDRASPTDQDPFPELDGGSLEIATLKEHMLRVAHDAHVTALILGESGTGKELVARAIHRVSPRRRAPFVVVNCAGLSPTLVEDELFGHVRGAYTGAIDDQPGPFERANGGTVFLDEVGELMPDLQIKLLRALQQRTVKRLGGRHETAFDVRVIAATNLDLAQATMRGRFRQDLYYRLKVYELRLPSLRHRGAAHLAELVTTILDRLAAQRMQQPAQLDRSVWELLVAYDWPGNVRELENTLERMIVAAGDERLLTRDHVPERFGAANRRVTRIARSHGTVVEFPRVPPSAADVATAFERNQFVLGRTAVELGLSRHQLYRLFKRYGLTGPHDRRRLACGFQTDPTAPAPDD